MNTKKLEAIKSHFKVTNLRIEKTNTQYDGYYLWTMYARNEKIASTVTQEDNRNRATIELIDRAYALTFPQTTVYEV